MMVCLLQEFVAQLDSVFLYLLLDLMVNLLEPTSEDNLILIKELDLFSILNLTCYDERIHFMTTRLTSCVPTPMMSLNTMYSCSSHNKRWIVDILLYLFFMQSWLFKINVNCFFTGKSLPIGFRVNSLQGIRNQDYVTYVLHWLNSDNILKNLKRKTLIGNGLRNSVLIPKCEALN